MNVLVLTHRLPYPPNRGDRVRAFHIIRHLQQRAQVHVVSLVHDAAEAAHVPALEKMGVRVSIARVPRLRNLVKAAASLATDAILTQAAAGGHVIARNKIEFFFPGGSVHGTDCIGGLPNFAPHGGFFSDTDVNDNTCIPSVLSGLDPWQDGALTPETFTPTCPLTFEVVSRGTARFRACHGRTLPHPRDQCRTHPFSTPSATATRGADTSPWTSAPACT